MKPNQTKHFNINIEHWLLKVMSNISQGPLNDKKPLIKNLFSSGSHLYTFY